MRPIYNHGSGPMRYTIDAFSASYKVTQLVFGERSYMENLCVFTRVVRVLSKYIQELPDIERKLADPVGNGTRERYFMVRRHMIYWKQLEAIKERKEMFDILMDCAKVRYNENARTFRATFQHAMGLMPLMSPALRTIRRMENVCQQTAAALNTSQSDPVVRFDEIPPFSIVQGNRRRGEVEEESSEDGDIDYGVQLNSDEIEHYLS